MAEHAQGRSSNFCRSKFKVKMNFKTVRTRLLPILKCIEAGNYPAKISRMLGLGKPHVAYYVKKLEQAGLVRRERRSNIVVYSVPGRVQTFSLGVRVRFLVRVCGVCTLPSIVMELWRMVCGLPIGVEWRR